MEARPTPATQILTDDGLWQISVNGFRWERLTDWGHTALDTTMERLWLRAEGGERVRLAFQPRRYTSCCTSVVYECTVTDCCVDCGAICCSHCGDWANEGEDASLIHPACAARDEYDDPPTAA